MPWLTDKLFDKYSIITKARLRLACCTGKPFSTLIGIVGNTHPFATTASTGFKHHRIANLFGITNGLFSIFDDRIYPGNCRHARGVSKPFGSNLIAHNFDCITRGADEDNALRFKRRRE